MIENFDDFSTWMYCHVDDILQNLLLCSVQGRNQRSVIAS